MAFYESELKFRRSNDFNGMSAVRLHYGPLLRNLQKRAKDVLKAHNYDHVVYGVVRNAKGHVRSYMIPCNDNQLDAFADYLYNKLGAARVDAMHAHRFECYNNAPAIDFNQLFA